MSESNRRAESLDLPISMLLETAIPSACTGCNTAYEVCAKFARQVINNQTSLEVAEVAVGVNLLTHCAGMLTRPGGWGTTSETCRYIEVSQSPPN